MTMRCTAHSLLLSNSKSATGLITMRDHGQTLKHWIKSISKQFWNDVCTIRSVKRSLGLAFASLIVHFSATSHFGINSLIHFDIQPMNEQPKVETQHS